MGGAGTLNQGARLQASVSVHLPYNFFQVFRKERQHVDKANRSWPIIYIQIAIRTKNPMVSVDHILRNIQTEQTYDFRALELYSAAHEAQGKISCMRTKPG